MSERAAKTVVVLQPMFFPWVGHLEQVRLADVFVHYDDVQYCTGSLMNRIRIKTAAGSTWMTVPVEHDGLQNLDATRLHARSAWRRKHLSLLAQAFAKAPYRDDVLELVAGVYAQEHTSLAALGIASIEAMARYFGIATPFCCSSALGVPGKGTQRVLDICRQLAATRYVTGHGARHYLGHEAFEAHGIEVQYMDYRRTPYPQLHGAFDPHVSALDLIANQGRAGLAVIGSGTRGWREFLQGATR